MPSFIGQDIKRSNIGPMLKNKKYYISVYINPDANEERPGICLSFSTATVRLRSRNKVIQSSLI